MIKKTQPETFEEYEVFNKRINGVGWRNLFLPQHKLNSIMSVWRFYEVWKDFYLRDKPELEKRIKELQQENKILKEQKTYEKEFKDYQTENKIFLENLERAGGEKIELARKLELAKMDCDNTRTDLINAKAEINELRLQITKIEKEKAEVKKELEATRKSTDYFSNELLKMEKALKDIDNVIHSIFASRGIKNKPEIFDDEVPF